jgi:protein SCO1
MKKLIPILFLSFIGLLNSCSNEHNLPIYGNRETKEIIVDGKTVMDTIYASVPDFSFVNQDSVVVNQETVKGKIYIADFFFASCPTICPIMKKQMIRVFEKYKGNPKVLLLSHTIDPEHDTIALLKDYATRLGSDGKQWMFLTGDREAIYDMAAQGYYATAMPDSTEPGGYVHSGGFILVDTQRRVRGIYNGTSEDEVTHLMKDMDILLKENE